MKGMREFKKQVDIKQEFIKTVRLLEHVYMMHDAVNMHYYIDADFLTAMHKAQMHNIIRQGHGSDSQGMNSLLKSSSNAM